MKFSRSRTLSEEDDKVKKSAGSSAGSGNNCLFFCSSGNQQSGNTGDTNYQVGTGSSTRKGCKYSEWISTTPCSVTCGDGLQTQSRSKHEYSGAGAEDCDGVLTRVNMCKIKPCPTTLRTPTTPRTTTTPTSPRTTTSPTSPTTPTTPRTTKSPTSSTTSRSPTTPTTPRTTKSPTSSTTSTSPTTPTTPRTTKSPTSSTTYRSPTTPTTPPQEQVHEHSLSPEKFINPVWSGFGTAGFVTAGTIFGETLAGLLPLFAFGKRDVPDHRQIIDLLIEKLQEKRDMMT